MVVPRVQAAIASAFGEEYRGTDPVVRPSQFADIQINAAMALAKKVGMPPRDAAARIVEALDLDGICTAVEISGPGFINLTFDGTWIEELLNAESPGARPCRRRKPSASSSTIPPRTSRRKCTSATCAPRWWATAS